MFADDSSLFCSANNYVELNNKCNDVLEKCADWLKCNGLTLNIQKTHYLDFSKTKEREIPLTLKIENEILTEQDHTKYLGLTFQNNLNWDIHISNVIKKFTQEYHYSINYEICYLFPKEL
jgi:hypothetical protein